MASPNLPPLPMGASLPETNNGADLENNIRQSENFAQTSEGTSQSYLNSFPQSGPGISDLMVQTQNYFDGAEKALKELSNMSMGQGGGGMSFNLPATSAPGASIANVYNPSKASEELSLRLNRRTPSLLASATPVNLGSPEEFERYRYSDDFQQFGYNPMQGKEQEYKYGRNMTWGDTMGKAINGGGALAFDTFVEGWKGWGRMTDALFSWDASKLMGSEQERYQIAKEQEKIFNKYAIYNTEDSEESIFNRQFFGNLVQQAGFTVGAAAQMVTEHFLTMGIGKALSFIAKGTMVAKGLKSAVKVEEIIDDMRKVQNVVSMNERVLGTIKKIPEALIPLYGSAQKLKELNRAGAGALQLASFGMGAIKKELSIFNMARSEAIFESASTYKDLFDKLAEQHYQTTGEVATGDDLEKIRNTADNASHDNFYTNLGILSVMNRLQFGNMFNSFNGTRKMFSDGVASLAEDAFEVTGKVAGKNVTKAYTKGMLGALGSVGDISKTFGRKKAAWEISKDIGKGLMKFETSEGVQELLQEASNKGLTDYYYDLYHGSKGYSSRIDSVYDKFTTSLTEFEGMKTFLMGALTGRLIAPFSSSVSYLSDYKNINERKAKAKEAVDLVNTIYSDPTRYLPEWIANVKVQNKAAETMEEAASKQNQYVYNNTKDSAFAKAVASAIKLNMYKSMSNTLREFGTGMTNDEFKDAFKMEASVDNKSNAGHFMNKIVDRMDEYFIMYNNLRDKYADRIIPDLYKNNDPKEYQQMKIAKSALDNAIEMITTNAFKAKRSVERAASLQEQIASNPNIGGSSIQILSKMGSEEGLMDQIMVLESEIKSISAAPAMTEESRKLLNEKREELKLSIKWRDAFDVILKADSENYNETVEQKAYDAFKDLVEYYNKKSNLTTLLSKEDIDSQFIKFTDYILLNQDSKNYTDAMNLLSDPTNLNFIHNVQMNSIRESAMKQFEEHKKEIEDLLKAETELAEEKKPEDTSSLGFENLGNIARDQGLALIETELLKSGKVVITDISKATPEQRNKLNADVEELKKKYPEKNITSRLEGDSLIIEVGSEDTSKTTLTEDEIKDYLNNLKTLTYPQFKLLIKSVGNNIDTLDNIVVEVEKNTVITTDQMAELIEEILNRIDELESAAPPKGSYLSPTDPVFISEYNLAVDKLNEILSNPNITEAGLISAYKLLNSSLKKLSPADKAVFVAKHEKEKNENLLKVKALIQSKNVAFHKSSITRQFSLNIPLAEMFDNILDIINISAHVSIKDELIKHFEERYISYVENKIKTLRKNINTTGMSSMRKKLFDIQEKFSEQLQKTIALAKDSAVLLANATKGIKLDVLVDDDFQNEVHLSIINSKYIDKEISSRQLQVLQNFQTSGFINPDELREVIEINTRVKASHLINKAIARMYTYEMNSLVRRFVLNPSKTKDKLIEMYASYLYKGGLKQGKDVDVSDTNLTEEEFNKKTSFERVLEFTKTIIDSVVTDVVDPFLDVDLYENERQRSATKVDKMTKEQKENYIEQMLNSLQVPITEKITDAQYTAISNFRINNSSLDFALNNFEKLNDINKFKEYLITIPEVYSEIDNLLTDEFINATFSSVFDLYNNKPFAIAIELISLLKNVSESTEIDKSLASIKTFAETYVRENANNLTKQAATNLVSAVIGNMLEVESAVTNSQTNTVKSLDATEMLEIIANPTKSLSQQDIEQVENFVKNELLQEQKKRFAAAIGYRDEDLNFSGQLADPEMNSKDARFSSLRPKFATDTRTSEQLASQLGVRDGKFSARSALMMIRNSPHATIAEKTLADQIFDLIPEGLEIIVDDTIPEAGAYDLNTNEVIVNLTAAGYIEDGPSVPLETVILHELLHSLTAKELDNEQSEYRKVITELYNIVGKHPAAKTFYAYTKGLSEVEKIAEFVSEAFTNPAFQYLLASMEYKKTKQSLWRRFVTVVNALLRRLGITISDNVLNEVIGQTSDLFNKPPDSGGITETGVPPPAPPSVSTDDKDEIKPPISDIDLAVLEDNAEDLDEGVEEPPQVDEELKSYYVELYKDIVSAATIKDLNKVQSKIKKAEKNNTLVEWQIKSLKNGVRYKKKTISTIENNKASLNASMISVNGKTYRYKIESNRLFIFSITRASGVRPVVRKETRLEIIQALYQKHKNYKKLLPQSLITYIEDLGGDPRVRGSYSSREMDDSTDLSFALFSDLFQREDDGSSEVVKDYMVHIGLNFDSEKTYSKFLNDYRKAVRDSRKYGGVTRSRNLQELGAKYGDSKVKEFGELMSMVGSAADIRKLINAGFISVTKGSTFSEIEAQTGGNKSRIKDLFDYVLSGKSLKITEKQSISEDINGLLKDYFNVDISEELQNQIESDVFYSDIFEESEPTEEEPTTEKDLDTKTELSLVEITSNLDPKINIIESALDFTKVDATVTKAAKEKYALRSHMLDIINDKETDDFKNHYYKIRNIINKLAVMDPEKHINLYVTLVSGTETRFRWDGSKKPIDELLKTLPDKGVVGYISDRNGNPIVFDPEGTQLGFIDRNDLDNHKGLNTGQNQIVYFNTIGENRRNKEIDFESESLNQLMEARKKAKLGIPQIARLTNFSVGQFNNKIVAGDSLVGQSLPNTKNDDYYKQVQKLLDGNVTLGYYKSSVIVTVTDDTGASNSYPFYTLNTNQVEVIAHGLPGEPIMKMYDYVYMLMKTYHQMVLAKHPNVVDVKKNLIDFLRGVWYTGKDTLQIPASLTSFSIKERTNKPILVGDAATTENKEAPALITMELFRIESNGQITENPDVTTQNKVRNYLNSKPINVNKKYLEGTQPFLVPALVQRNGVTTIEFERQDYFDFLMRRIGMKTRLFEIKTGSESKRYHSGVQFGKPDNLEIGNTIQVPTQDDILNNENAVKNNVNDTVKDTTKKITDGFKPLPTNVKKRRFKAPSFNDILYKKICK